MKSKKILAAVMCLNLCLTAVACTNKEDSSTTESTTVAETTVTEADGSSQETTEEKNEIDYNVVKTFWKANIPDTLKENEEKAEESSDSSSNLFEALDSEGEVERSVKVEITNEDAMDYRKGLSQNA